MYITDQITEKAILSGILQNGFESFVDVDDLIGPKSFSNEHNEAIYQTIKYIYTQNKNSKIDIPTLFTTLKEIGFPDIGRTYLTNLFDAKGISSSNLRIFAGKIRKLEIARGIKDKLSEIDISLNDINGSEPLAHICGLVENPILDYLLTLGQSDDMAPKKIGHNIMERIEYLANNKRELVGISSGFGYYDVAIGGGFRRKTVNVVGARIKVGKSFLAANITKHVAGNLNIPVLYLDTELDEEYQQYRFLATCSGVGIQNIETGYFSDSPITKKKVEEAGRFISDIPYYYNNISGQPMEDTISIMRRWLFREVGYNKGITNDCLIILDYLKLMDEKELGGLQEYQRLGFMMTALHNFAVKYDVPIFILTQLNKDGIERESTGVVSGSDRIGWLCSNLSIFKEKSDEELQRDGLDAGNRKMVVLASRHGEKMPFGQYISMNANLGIGLITEVGTATEELEIFETDNESAETTDIQF